MRLKTFFCLATFLCASVLQAQNLQISVNQKGKVGFVDDQGNVVVKCIYDSAQPFANGVSIVSKGDKQGMIDATGKVVLPIKYKKISTWTSDILQISDGKKCGLISKEGRIIIKPTYSFISRPNCYGKALVTVGGKPLQEGVETYMNGAKCGIISDKGEVLVKPKYRGLYEFTFDGTCAPQYHEGKRLTYSHHFQSDTLQTDCAYLGFEKTGMRIFGAGVMDGTGKELMKPGKYTFVMQPQGGMIRYYIRNKKNTECGYYNISTKKAFLAAKFKEPLDSLTFWTHGDFIGDIAPVNGTQWSFIDKNGKTLRTGYSSINHGITTGLWGAKNAEGLWEVFDEQGNDVASLSGYSDICFPQQPGDKEIFAVARDGKYGLIDRSGQTAIPFDYEQATGNNFDVVCVKQNGKWGAISPSGSVIVPLAYEGLNLASERGAQHFWVKETDGLYHHYNLTTGQTAGQGFKSAMNFSKGYAVVVPKDMKVDDTPLNRALLCDPFSKKEVLEGVKVADNAGAFGYLVDTDDQMVLDRPVTLKYKDEFIKRHAALGKKQLSESEIKGILLDITVTNRSYDLKTKIDESEWDF